MLKNGDVLTHPMLDSHSDLVTYFRLPDTRVHHQHFAKVELVPDNWLDVDTWQFRLDEETVPGWWEDVRGAAESTLRGRAKTMILVTGETRLIVDGCWIVGGDAVVSDVRGGRILRVQDSARITNVWGGTITDVGGGTITDVWGGTITGVWGGTITDVRGGTITEVCGGTITDVRGGTITDVSGGTITHVGGSAQITDVWGGTITDVRGGTITDVRGGTITRVSGGTITDVGGGTITDVWGGTITDVWGGTITDVRGGTITGVRGAPWTPRLDASAKAVAKKASRTTKTSATWKKKGSRP